MTKVTSCFLFLLSVAIIAIAGRPASDLPVTHIIADTDMNLVPYSIQSDARGPFQNGANGDTSVLMANVYNGLTWGDRLLQSGTVRKLALTFSPENAVQPGDPGYVVPASPPVWGTISTGVRFMNKCTIDNLSMYTMKSGDKITCQMHIRMYPLGTNDDYYRIDMGTPGEDETQKVQISCNSTNSGACNDWYIDPIPVVNGDGSTSPGKTRARLNFITTHGKGSITNEGAFYMTFHVHVTRP